MTPQVFSVLCLAVVSVAGQWTGNYNTTAVGRNTYPPRECLVERPSSRPACSCADVLAARSFPAAVGCSGARFSTVSGMQTASVARRKIDRMNLKPGGVWPGPGWRDPAWGGEVLRL